MRPGRSNQRLGRDGIAAAEAESFFRDLQTRSSLLALVFAFIHHASDLADQLRIETMLRRNRIGRLIVLNVVLQDCIEYLIRRQRVAVLLAGP